MASTITITWVINLKPEVVDAFWSDVAGGISGTRSFPGCLRADLFRGADDPNQVLLNSEWESRENYEKYSAWRREGGRLIAGVSSSELPSLFTTPTNRQFWTVKA